MNDFLGGERFQYPLIFQEGCYLACVDPGDLEEQIEKALMSTKLSDKMRQKLLPIQADMTENDNNYLLYAKLKGGDQ